MKHLITKFYAWLNKPNVLDRQGIIIRVLLLFSLSSNGQVPIGDTITIPTTITLIDTTSYYRVYYSNWSVKQSQVLWKDVRVPNNGHWEELDYRSGGHFESKGYTVNVTRDSTGRMDIIEYLGLNRKPFPAPYIPLEKLVWTPKKLD